MGMTIVVEVEGQAADELRERISTIRAHLDSLELRAGHPRPGDDYVHMQIMGIDFSAKIKVLGGLNGYHQGRDRGPAR